MKFTKVCRTFQSKLFNSKNLSTNTNFIPFNSNNVFSLAKKNSKLKFEFMTRVLYETNRKKH